MPRLEQSGGRPGGPQAGAVRGGQAQRAQRGVAGLDRGAEGRTGRDEEHEGTQHGGQGAAPRGERVDDEHEHRAERGQEGGREDDGVDGDEVGGRRHGAVPIAATAAAVIASSGPGMTPRKTIATASTAMTPASTPAVSRVRSAPRSGRSPTQTTRATRRAYAADSAAPTAATTAHVTNTPRGRSGAGSHAAYDGEQLSPEAGEAGQPEAGRQAQDEEEAEAGRGLAQGGARDGQVDAPPALLEAADEHEEQRRDDAVGDVGEQGGLQAGLGAGREGEHDEAHVGHRRVGDEPLEVALDEADEGAPDDADDPGDREDGAQRGEALGHRGERQPDEAVRAHLQEHGGEQHRPGSGGRRVGRGQPGVEGEDRHLDREAGDEEGGHEQLPVGRERGAGAAGERPQVGGARRGDEQQDADEHQRGAERGVEHEPVSGIHPGALVVAVAVAADEHPHRHEHELEREEEEHGIPRGERRERPRLDEEQAAEEGRGSAALGQVDPGVRGHEHADERGEEQERHGDAVDPERPAQPQLAEPDPVDVGVRDGDDDREHEGEPGGRRGGDPGRGDGQRPAAGHEPEADGGRDGQEQAHDHASTPARPSTTTAARTRPTADAGRSPRCARAPAQPATRVATAVART